MYAADLAYLNCLDEFHEVAPLREVPEYAVPVFRVPHPWNKLHFTDSSQAFLCNDFILVVEFSELEGPRPLITIPKDGAESFNLNDFAVRIMSVDQNTSVSDGFHIIEDFQVIMTELRDNVFAFVHHFVLYDQQARGYVRPFAVSYVTADRRKLICFYEEITIQMKKVARYFKYGNKLVFRNDLERHLKDVEYTKSYIWQRYKSGDNEEDVMSKIKQLATQSGEVQNVLSIIKPMMNDKRLEQRFNRMEEKAKIHKNRDKLDSISLKGLDHIDNDVPISGSLGHHEEITMSIDLNTYKPKIVSLGGRRKFDAHLRGLHELCSWGAKDGLQKLRHIHQHFQRDMALLQEEKMNTEYIEPSSGLLVFGNQCLAANFMAKIDKLCVGSICTRLVPKSETTSGPKFFIPRISSNDTLDSFQSLSSSFQSIPDYDSYDNISLASASSQIYTTTVRVPKEMEESSHTLVLDEENQFYTEDDGGSGWFTTADNENSPRFNTQSESADNNVTPSLNEKPEASPLKWADSETSSGLCNKPESLNCEDNKNPDGVVRPWFLEDSYIGTSSGYNVRLEHLDSVDSQNSSGSKADSQTNNAVNITDSEYGCVNSVVCTPAKSHECSPSINALQKPLEEADNLRSSEISVSSEPVVKISDNENSPRISDLQEPLDESDTTESSGYNAGTETSINSSDCESSSRVNVDSSGGSQPCNENLSFRKSVITKNGVLAIDSPQHCFYICDKCQVLVNDHENNILRVSENDRIVSNCELINDSLKRTKVDLDAENISLLQNSHLLNYKTCQKCLMQFSQPLKDESTPSISTEEELYHQPMLSINQTEIFPNDEQIDLSTSGFGLKKLLSSYNNMQPLVYSLLIGRPVFIVGTASHETDIRSYVKILRIFLTSYHRRHQTCVLWTCCVPHLTDLSKIKLLGLCRPERKSLDRFIPKSIKKLVTIMDLDKKMIYSPAYHGAFVNTLLAKKYVFKSEDSFLSFVQSCLLDISSKAFIYFHSFCLGTASTFASGYTMPRQSEAYSSTISTFLNKLGIHDCDINIVQYLAEVIKYQHLEDHYHADKKSGVPAHPVQITYQSCQVFKC